MSYFQFLATNQDQAINTQIHIQSQDSFLASQDKNGNLHFDKEFFIDLFASLLTVSQTPHTITQVFIKLSLSVAIHKVEYIALK